jgi:undecaprenyl-diphosphatase
MLKRLIQKIMLWDLSLNNWVTQRQGANLRKTFQIVTYLGSGYIWALVYLIMFIFCTDKVKSILFSIILAELLGLLIIIVLRNLIKRERPTADMICLLPLSWCKNSFPSHHALRVSMLATIFGTSYPSWLPFLIFCAAVVSISRVYLERHYPTDVLAGSFVGFLCARLALLRF